MKNTNIPAKVWNNRAREVSFRLCRRKIRASRPRRRPRKPKIISRSAAKNARYLGGGPESERFFDGNIDINRIKPSLTTRMLHKVSKAAACIKEGDW